MGGKTTEHTVLATRLRGNLENERICYPRIGRTNSRRFFSNETTVRSQEENRKGRKGLWSGSRPFWSCVQRRRANNLEAEIGPGEDALRLAQTFNLGRDGVLANVEVLHQEVAALVELGLVGRELLRVLERSGQIALGADLRRLVKFANFCKNSAKISNLNYIF